MSKEGKIANEQTESTHENEVEEVGVDIESSNASGYSASGESVAPPADSDNNDGSNTETSPNPYLPRSVQTEMESSFNQDFSNVNVYQNSSKANAYGARAYAYGNEIHFSEGQYNPYSKEGQQLLKHELAHVVQQRQGRTDQPTEALEREADQISLYDSGYFQLDNQSVAVESPMVQFKWYEIKKKQIGDIRGMLFLGQGLKALEEIKRILQVDEVIAKFLAEYEDIGIALLKHLDTKDSRDEYMYVDSLFVVPFKAIDAENLRVLQGYREQEGKETLEDIAEMTGVDLDEMISLSGMSREYIDFDVSEFLLKLEENLSDEKKQEEGIKEFLHQLAFHNMFEKVEDQGDEKIENKRPAADSKYADNGFYSGIKVGLSFSRQISLEDEREAKKNAKRGKEKRAARKSLRKAKREHPNIGGLFIRQLFQNLISMKGVRLGEISKLLGIQGIYGVSFGDDAIVNLKLDRKNQELIITAEQLPMDRLNYVDEASGSAYLADQINLVSPEIRLKINQSNKLKIGESAAVTMTVTTDAVDILNMRILGRESTIGMGRIRGNGLELKYTQQLSRGHKMRTMHLFLTLMEMVMKGPSMIQPFIYEIVNAFTLSDENREEESKKQQKLFFESIKGGLADELDFSLKFDDLEVTHFYMTQEYAPEDVSIKKAGEQFRPTYIERIVLSRDELEDKKHEFGIKSESLTEEQLKAAIDNLPEDAFDEATRQKILSVRPKEEGGSYVELYEELVAEYNRVRLKKIPDDPKHLSAQEKTLIEVMEYLKPFAIETMEEYQAAQESEGYKSLSGPAKKTIELITCMYEYASLKLLYKGLQLRMKAPEIIENRESAVMQAVNFLSNIDIRSKEDLALAKGQMSAPMEQLNEMFGITEFSDEAKAIIESLESMVDYRDLMREYKVSTNKKQSKQEKRKSIIDAAEYFESYRTFDFNVNSHEGAIEGGEMIENLAVPMIDDMLKGLGMNVKTPQGIGDITFKSLDIKTTQNSFGFIYDKDSTPEERNYIELEAVLPKLSGDAIDFVTGDIDFKSKAFQFDNISVPLKLKFQDRLAKGTDKPQDSYKLILGKIHIEKGTVLDDSLNYGDLFGFSSGKSVFEDIYIEAYPIPDVKNFSLEFAKVSLHDSKVEFGGRSIESTEGNPIELHDGKYVMDPISGNTFTLQDMVFAGEYLDGDDKVQFDQWCNELCDEPLVYFNQRPDGHKHIKLNINSTIKIPEVSFGLPVGKKSKLTIGEDQRGATFSKIYVDIEMAADGRIYFNEVSFGSLKTDDFKVEIDDARFGNKTIGSDEVGGIELSEVSLKNLAMIPVKSDLNPEQTMSYVFGRAEREIATESVIDLMTLGNSFQPQLPENKNFIWEDPSIPRNREDMTKLTNDPRLIDARDATFSIGQFSFDNSSYEDAFKDPSMRILLEIFAFNSVFMTSTNGRKYEAGELYKVFSHAEVEGLVSRGTVEKMDGKEKEIVAMWDVMGYDLDSEALTVDYDYETDMMTLKNFPSIDLHLPKVDLKAGDVEISTEKSGGNLADLFGLKINQVRIDMFRNELIVDDVVINEIGATGLGVKHSGLDFDFNVPPDQYASVSGISLSGWKWKLAEEGELEVAQDVGKVDINNLYIGKVMAGLSEMIGKEMKEPAEVGARTGKIEFRMFKDSSLSVSVEDPEFLDGKFDFFATKDDYIKNFLNYSNMDKITVKVDAQKRTTILLKNPTIYGYEFSSTDQYGRSYISARATLRCVGELRIFEGNYDQFVYGMEKELKDFDGDHGIQRTTGEVDAWLIDGSGCVVTITDLEFVKAAERDTRTTTEILVDQILNDGQSISEEEDPEEYVRRMERELTIEDFGENDTPQEWRTLLEQSSEQKLEAQQESVQENSMYLDMINVLESSDATINAGIFGERMLIDLEDGWINFIDLRDELSAVIGSWTQELSRLPADQLMQNDGLQSMASQAMSYLNYGLRAETSLYGTAGGATAGTIIGGVIGGVIGFFGGFGVGTGAGIAAGMKVGAVIGAAIGQIGGVYAKELIAGELVQLLEAFLVDVRDENNYANSLNDLLQYVLSNLSVESHERSEDSEEDDSGIYLTLTIQVNLSPQSGVTDIPIKLLKLGDLDDDHVNVNGIHLAGLTRYMIENPLVAPDGAEQTLLSAIDELPEGTDVRDLILQQIAFEQNRDWATEMEGAIELGTVTGAAVEYLAEAEGWFGGGFGANADFFAQFAPGFLASQFTNANLQIQNIDFSVIEEAFRQSEDVDFNLFEEHKSTVRVDAQLNDNSEFDENFNRTQTNITGGVQIRTIPGFTVNLNNNAFGLGYSTISGLSYSMDERVETKASERENPVVQDAMTFHADRVKAFGFQAAIRKDGHKVEGALSRPAEFQYHTDRLTKKMVEGRVSELAPTARLVKDGELDEDFAQNHEGSKIVAINPGFYWANDFDWRVTNKLLRDISVDPDASIIFVRENDWKVSSEDFIGVYGKAEENYPIIEFYGDRGASSIESWLNEYDTNSSPEDIRAENKQIRNEIEQQYWEEHSLALPREEESTSEFYTYEIGRRLFLEREHDLSPEATILNSRYLNKSAHWNDLGPDKQVLKINEGFYWLYQLDPAAAYEFLRREGIASGTFPNFELNGKYLLVVNREHEEYLPSDVLGELTLGRGPDIKISPKSNEEGISKMELWINSAQTAEERKRIAEENQHSINTISASFWKLINRDVKAGKNRTYIRPEKSEGDK